MFTGFTQETLAFFTDIRFHNDKQFFEANRDRFEQQVKAPFAALIDELAPTMQRIDPTMEVRPWKCLARIRRDTRFSRDKSPYRDHLWFLFRRAAEPREGAVMFWFELSVRHVDWGLGTWGENRGLMDMLRRQIAARPDEIRRIITRCRLQDHDIVASGKPFHRLPVPDSVPEDLRSLYCMHDVYFSRKHPDYSLIDKPELADVLREDFLALAPCYHLLRGALDAWNDQ